MHVTFTEYAQHNRRSSPGVHGVIGLTPILSVICHRPRSRVPRSQASSQSQPDVHIIIIVAWGGAKSTELPCSLIHGRGSGVTSLVAVGCSASYRLDRINASISSRHLRMGATQWLTTLSVLTQLRERALITYRR